VQHIPQNISSVTSLLLYVNHICMLKYFR